MSDTTAPLQVTSLEVLDYKVNVQWVEPTGLPPLGGDIDHYDIYVSTSPINVLPSGNPLLSVNVTEAEVPITVNPLKRQYIAIVAVDTSDNKSKVRVVSTRITKPVDVKRTTGRSSQGFYIFF